MKDHVEIQQSNCIKVVKTVHRFLKDLKNAKLTLASKNQSYILRVWDVRSCHMVAGLPAQYIFMLACCYKSLSAVMLNVKLNLLLPASGIVKDRQLQCFPYLQSTKRDHGGELRVINARELCRPLQDCFN